MLKIPGFVQIHNSKGTPSAGMLNTSGKDLQFLTEISIYLRNDAR